MKFEIVTIYIIINVFKMYFEYLRMKFLFLFKKKFVPNFKLYTKLNSYNIIDDFFYLIFQFLIFLFFFKSL